MVSSKKNKFTSAAGINLGAIVTNTNGIATHRMHIKGTIIRSLFSRTKLSIKNNAKVATNNFPTPAAGTKFIDLAHRIITEPNGSPMAVKNPKRSPRENESIESTRKTSRFCRKCFF